MLYAKIVTCAYFGALALAGVSVFWQKARVIEPRMLGLVIIALAVLTITGCAGEPMSRRDIVMESVYAGTLIIDASQTADIQYRDGIHEAGPVARRVLGRQPSTSGTWQYFASVLITHYLITRALPSKWRPYWQGAGIVSEVPVIVSNCKLGLGRMCNEN